MFTDGFGPRYVSFFFLNFVFAMNATVSVQVILDQFCKR